MIHTDTFNFSRFKNVLLWQFAMRRKFYINVLAASFLLVVVLSLPSLFLTFSGSNVNKATAIFVFLMSAYLMTCGAFIVSNITEKRQRISLFLLPASRLEKFTSRYLCILIGFPLAAFIGFVAGDLVQMGVTAISGKEVMSGTALLFNQNNAINASFFSIPGVVGAIITTIISSWYMHSLFLLFGTFFRRHAWIKSMLAMLALCFIIVGIVGGIAYCMKVYLDNLYGEGSYVVELANYTAATIIGNIALLGLIVFNYWAAFRVYSRMQAVGNKWHNF